MNFRSIFAGVLAGAGLAYYLYKRSRAHKTGLDPVHPFEPEKFLGKWYEIARLDNWFEKNLDNTTAHYSLNRDGTIRVINKGYNYVTHEHKQSTGVAKFTGARDTGALRVSFFGPFYSDYIIIALDKRYQYALVAGKNLDYLWILSRETSIPEKTLNYYLELADSLGYDVRKLVKVEHDQVVDHSRDSLVDKALHQLFVREN